MEATAVPREGVDLGASVRTAERIAAVDPGRLVQLPDARWIERADEEAAAVAGEGVAVGLEGADLLPRCPAPICVDGEVVAGRPERAVMRRHPKDPRRGAGLAAVLPSAGLHVAVDVARAAEVVANAGPV